MSEPKPEGLAERLSRAVLAFDSTIDDGIFRLGRHLREGWERFSAFMYRFHLAGWKRGAVEVLSESATLGTAGLVLILALAVPAFRETSDDWLRQHDISVTFLDRYGNEIGKRGIRHSDAVPLEEFPDHLVKAVLATEDRRFFDHFGIDIIGTFRALITNARAQGVVQGGSTLTQQLAKNLFLSNERSIERKIKEAFLALWLEARLSKSEILKLYLDRAYMGGGAFGVEAAAQYYFGKSARDVTLSEAAMLAGLFKAPSRFAPHANLANARARANTVLDNLVEAGFMTEGQVFGARRNPATPVDREEGEGPNYYLDYAFQQVRTLVEELPKTVTDRVFVVRTGIDMGIQRQAETIVEETLRTQGPEYNARQAALVLIENDGTVRAMIGGRDYGASQFNRATDALRQPGSSFKPFVYVTAFMNGYSSRSVVRDEPVCIQHWCPQNYSRSFSGAVTLSEALARSINTIPVRLSLILGRDKVVETARRMGINSDLKSQTWALPLGVTEVTVADMASAYSVLANGGRRVDPFAVLEIRNTQGEVFWTRERNARPAIQLIPPPTVADLNQVLVRAVENGTGRRAILEGIKVAGKTGTTQSYRDAWFVGYTGNYSMAVWFGNDDYTPTRRMTGGSLPAQTWQRIMAYAHQGIDIVPLFGVDPPRTPAAPQRPPQPGDAIALPRERPQTLTRRSADALMRLQRRFGETLRSMGPAPAPVSAVPAATRAAISRDPAIVAGYQSP